MARTFGFVRYLASFRACFRRGAPELVLVFACATLAACSNAGYQKQVTPDASTSRDGASQADGRRDAPASPGVCAPGTVERSKGKSEACTCDSECQTGYCVDGLCCNSSCDSTCMACDLPSSLGECAVVPSGRKPSDPSQCPADTAATCGKDGTCDGKGGCRQYPAGTECKAGHCDGDRVADVLACDGSGHCSQTTSTVCAPYSCNTATNRCATSCTTDSQCVSGQQCLSQRCGLSSNGAVCASADDCASGFCVDGYCCNVACTGACVTCSQTGSLGHCTYVPAGLPDSQCKAQDRSTCGLTGLCDGSGSCTLYPENTICGPSSCSGLNENTQRTCDGLGTCRDSSLVDCRPFLCTSGACATSCDPTKPDTCETGHQCTAQAGGGPTTGVCGPKQNGQPCLGDNECSSRHCVDRTCCESDCSGPCRSCSLAASPGRCVNVAAGASDPRQTCKDLGVEQCSTNGVCDGKGGCASYPEGTECGKEGCAAGVYNPPPTCNASSQCVASRSRTCSPYACNGTACATICASNDQCASGQLCLSNSCGLKPNGASCGGAKECTSGFCAQGVCCDSACTGACMTCGLTASAGTCTTVPDGKPDPQGKCAVTAAATCGTTGLCAKGVCAYQAPGANCKDAACANQTSLTPASKCDGKGACVTPQNAPCGTFQCAGGACKTTCTSASEAQDCVAPNTCANGSCGLKVNGAACTAASQCQSGFCTEGVCCNSACTDASDGLCKTCKGTHTTQVGTCGAVDSGGNDPKSRCVKSNVAGGECSNDGTCNGSGACRPWPSGTGCRPESCTGSTHTLPATCNGTGTCPSPVTVSCGSYVCSGVNCLNTCKTNADCTNNLTCVTSPANHCGSKLGAGETCNVDSDCDTGLVCSGEKVCCDKSCGSGCQSCKLSGKLGVCSNLSSGSAPRATSPATCAAAAPGACGASGNCDGSGGCEQRATCTASVTACPADAHQQFTSAGMCSASGVCGPLTSACGAGYLCTAGACATTCTAANASTNCDVANGYSCISGVCRKKDNGTSCAQKNECSSGNCVDGICCSVASCPDCQSCNITGKLGTCQNVALNSPDGACTGTCPSLTQAQGLCDGLGACKPLSTCPAGNACQAGLCANTCSSDAGCPTGYACASGSCKLALGQTCSGDGTCASGHCVDGVCCGSASCTDCNSCNVAGHLGSCAPVAAGTADGNCVLACGGSQIGGLCDGVGTCLPQSPCPGGFLCATPTQCATSCSPSTTSCAPGFYCSGVLCVAQKGNGTACGGDTECTSGHCVDGVCCSTGSCASDCQSCNVTGKAGTCQNVTANTAHGACTGSCPTATSSKGLCDGSGACKPAADCGAYICQAGICQIGCSTNSDCAPNYACASGACKLAVGQTCSGDTVCASGHCVDGVCCGSASCTDCNSCNIAGSLGTCAPVPVNTADGTCTARCPLGSNEVSGACNGSGACIAPAACPGGTVCGANNQCAVDCGTVGCAVGYFCSGTTCTQLKADGAGCAADGECQHGHCISDGTSNKICCASACTATSCGTMAACAANGAGCQSHGNGDPCSTATAGCLDAHTAVSASGTCQGSMCQGTQTPCGQGYVCVGTACVGPGGCTPPNGGCDTGYSCNSSGNCELTNPDAAL